MVVEFVKRNWVYALDGWVRNLCAIGKGGRWPYGGMCLFWFVGSLFWGGGYLGMGLIRGMEGRLVTGSWGSRRRI